jgi:hypothetical protein
MQPVALTKRLQTDGDASIRARGQSRGLTSYTGEYRDTA